MTVTRKQIHTNSRRMPARYHKGHVHTLKQKKSDPTDSIAVLPRRLPWARVLSKDHPNFFVTLINFVKFHPSCDIILCIFFARTAFEALIKSPKIHDIRFEIGSGLARAYGSRTRSCDWCTWLIMGG